MREYVRGLPLKVLPMDFHNMDLWDPWQSMHGSRSLPDHHPWIPMDFLTWAHVYLWIPVNLCNMDPWDLSETEILHGTLVT